MSESLLTFVNGICKENHLRVEEDFGDGFVRLLSDEAQRRQAIQDIRCPESALLEMLRNARDAHARTIFVSLNKYESDRFITVIDDGDGIPEYMHTTIFEPRVTSKLDSSSIDKWGVHGRGMALYSISVNAKSARVFASEKNLGSSIGACFDTTVLPEKKDQSSFPRFIINGKDGVLLKGPRNLLRTICEFSLEHRNTLEVYVGSPAEIAATLYAYGLAHTTSIDRIFNTNTADVPYVKRLAFAADEAHFCSVCDEIGLHFSARTARRIMNGDIQAQPCVIDLIQARIELPNSKTQKSTSKRKPHAQHAFSNEDLQAFKRETNRLYRELAQRYYLDPNVELETHIANDKLYVSIPLIDL